MQYTYQDGLFHCSKQFSNSSILMPFSASAVFCFTSPTSAKHFHLRTFFIWGNKQTKVIWGKIRWIGRVGHRGHVVFGQKLLNTQPGVSTCVHKSPIVKWALTMSLQKKFVEDERNLSQQCQLIHQYRWVPRHSPRGRSLCNKGPVHQMFLEGPPSYLWSKFISQVTQLGTQFYIFIFLASTPVEKELLFHITSGKAQKGMPIIPTWATCPLWCQSSGQKDERQLRPTKPHVVL